MHLVRLLIMKGGWEFNLFLMALAHPDHHIENMWTCGWLRNHYTWLDYRAMSVLLGYYWFGLGNETKRYRSVKSTRKTCKPCTNHIPDIKIHGANMGLTWVLSAPDGPRVGPMNHANRDDNSKANTSPIIWSAYLNGIFQGGLWFWLGIPPSEDHSECPTLMCPTWLIFQFDREHIALTNFLFCKCPG